MFLILLNLVKPTLQLFSTCLFAYLLGLFAGFTYNIAAKSTDYFHVFRRSASCYRNVQGLIAIVLYLRVLFKNEGYCICKRGSEQLCLQMQRSTSTVYSTLRYSSGTPRPHRSPLRSSLPVRPVRGPRPSARPTGQGPRGGLPLVGPHTSPAG